MCPLDLATAGTSAKTVHILQRLSSQLPGSLFRVGDLVLWHSPQHGFPNIIDGGEVQRDAGDRNRQRREELLCELAEGNPRQEARGGESGEESGSHLDGEEEAEFEIVVICRNKVDSDGGRGRTRAECDLECGSK